MKEDDFRLKDSTIAIIGLGLMGGSLALALKGHCRSLTGIDSHPATLEAALAKKIVDQAESDPAKLLPYADLVILAAPVRAIIEWLGDLPGYIEQPCIVMDIGSTKRAILQAMQKLPANFEPIGGHPVCGREQLSIQHADQNLYQGAPFIITALDRTSGRARSAAKQIISSVGAHMLELTAERHDRTLASTSHLPFLLACALSLGTSLESAPFIGTGFRSASRLAGTPASMMLGVLESNRDNISSSIQRFRESLSLIESALNSQDSLALENILDQSRHSYENLVSSHS